MAFDWQTFLDSNSIHYVTSGPNVSRGHVAVKCPFCGTQDPSQHMSINLNGKGWSCWRQQDHSGKSPTRLVAALLGISLQNAAALVGDSAFIPEDFIGAVRSKLAGALATEPTSVLRLPKEFKPIGNLPSARPYRAYLARRGFTTKQIDKMTARYGLYYATRGRYRGRLVFTVERRGKLQTWTARSIYPDADIRYLTLSVNDETTPAISVITENVLWYDRLRRGGDTLVLCEGPFDALKVSVLGRSFGFAATCCFTAAPSDSQIELLHRLAPRYRRKVLLLDRGTLATSIKVSTGLSALQMQTILLPKGIKDPGELTAAQFAGLFRLQG